MASDELAPFVLKNVKGLDSDEKKGSGAYGAVYEVTVKGVTCIAKRIHDILVTQVSPRERTSVQQNFAAECVLLSKLRHPNVVHFVGVHYGRSKNDLSLIMECLHTDLSKFLEGSSSEIPLSIKLSILLDVSYGLLYFHNHTPPIIHRDLSAGNVLLTTDLRAKICDLGVAKLLDFQTQVAIAQTKAPGSLHYMPPEALEENPDYNLKLDIFSFGHLTLYVAAQKPPSVHELDERTTYTALKKRTIQIRRRRRAIDEIGGERHTLYPLITQCLQDKQERRPTTSELNNRLNELCTKYPRSVTEISKLMAHTDKKTGEEADKSLKDTVVQLEDQLEKHRQKAEQVEKQLEVLTVTNRIINEKCHQLELENGQLTEKLKRLSGLNAVANTLVNELKAEIRKLQEKSKSQSEEEIAKTEGEFEEKPDCQGCLDLKQELATVQEENTKLAEEVDTLHQDNQSLEEALNDANIWGKGLRDLVVKLQTSNWQKEEEKEMLRSGDQPQGEVSEDELKRTVSEQHQMISRLLKQKDELQNSLQIAATEAQIYKEDFASERSDRENAHEKLADLEEKHAEEVGTLTAKLYQMEEAGKHKGKKLFGKSKQAWLQDFSMESHDKELVAERDKLTKELHKMQKELEKAKKDTEKAKAEAEKYKKENENLRKNAKRKGLDKLAVSPRPRIVLEEFSHSPRMSPVPFQAMNDHHEIMEKDEGSKQDQSPFNDQSPLHKSPSFPRLSSPKAHPVASSLTSEPSLRNQTQTQQVPQSTLQLKFPESPQQTHPKTLPIPIPVSSDPLSDGEF